MLRVAAYVGLAAMAVSSVALIPRFRSRSFFFSFAMGLAAAAPPFALQQQARSAPPINDISTDAPGAAQRAGYPDIASIMLGEAKEEAFGRTLAVARELGWEIIAADPAGGRFDAVDTTLWFGFKDDVTVRVAAAPGGGSRVDVRSKSRVGVSDVGANAKRIRSFRAKLLK